ncbi:unnamed protein product [Lathyrus oleraceus]
MASLMFAPLAFVLLAAFLMFQVKKVESGYCSPVTCYTDRSGDCQFGCICYPSFFGYVGSCQPYVSVAKMVDDHPNLCQSHDECTKKGTGSFCGRYPDSNMEYGRCFSSKFQAEVFFVKMISNSQFKKDLLKMSVSASY